MRPQGKPPPATHIAVVHRRQASRRQAVTSRDALHEGHALGQHGHPPPLQQLRGGVLCLGGSHGAAETVDSNKSRVDRSRAPELCRAQFDLTLLRHESLALQATVRLQHSSTLVRGLCEQWRVFVNWSRK